MPAEMDHHKKPQAYGLVLFVLTGLFCFRVLAQLVQIWHPLSFLPSFEAWHSGALPYWLLVCAQGFIVILCLHVSWRMFQGTVTLSAKKGKVLLLLGSIYFGIMLGRLIIGITVASEHFWFGAILPTVFHLVLATFLLVYGYFHFRGYTKSVSMGKEEVA